MCARIRCGFSIYLTNSSDWTLHDAMAKPSFSSTIVHHLHPKTFPFFRSKSKIGKFEMKFFLFYVLKSNNITPPFLWAQANICFHNVFSDWLENFTSTQKCGSRFWSANLHLAEKPGGEVRRHNSGNNQDIFAVVFCMCDTFSFSLFCDSE